MKRKKTKEARVDTPVGELSQKDTLAHYNAVLMEHIDSKIELILEALGVNTEKVSDLEETVRMLSERVSTLEKAVGLNSKKLASLDTRISSLEARMSTVETGMRGLKEDMLDMERRICSKINRMTERFDTYDHRLTSLEA